VVTAPILPAVTTDEVQTSPCSTAAEGDADGLTEFGYLDIVRRRFRGDQP
jgi:hypothetical protein